MVVVNWSSKPTLYLCEKCNIHLLTECFKLKHKISNTVFWENEKSVKCFELIFDISKSWLPWESIFLLKQKIKFNLGAKWVNGLFLEILTQCITVQLYEIHLSFGVDIEHSVPPFMNKINTHYMSDVRSWADFKPD